MRKNKIQIVDKLRYNENNSLKADEERDRITFCASSYLREQKFLPSDDKEAPDRPLTG